MRCLVYVCFAAIPFCQPQNFPSCVFLSRALFDLDFCRSNGLTERMAALRRAYSTIPAHCFHHFHSQQCKLHKFPTNVLAGETLTCGEARQPRSNHRCHNGCHARVRPRLPRPRATTVATHECHNGCHARGRPRLPRTRAATPPPRLPRTRVATVDATDAAYAAHNAGDNGCRICGRQRMPNGSRSPATMRTARARPRALQRCRQRFQQRLCLDPDNAPAW